MKLRDCTRFVCTLALAGVLGWTAGCNDNGDPAVTVASTGPNAVSYWDEVATNTINAPASASDATQAEKLPNIFVDMATVHVAIYDTAAAITGTHQPFKVTPVSPAAAASIDAAIGAAAYGVLKGLFPNRAALYQAKYDDALAAIADGPEKSQGIALGAEVAMAMLADRADDGRAVVLAPYVPGTLPGQFRGTNPVGRNNPYIKPFSITSAAQFRAPGPPALASAAYTADFKETRDLGSAGSTLRTPEQTEAARFNTEPPPGFWTRNLRQFATSQATVDENARLMAMLYVAGADLTIACFESKYYYQAWRPTSAITLADTDGNADTVADPTWTPVVPTPNHPEYPAAHACTFGAVGEVLRSFYGTRNLSFSFDSTVAGISPAGMVHAYSSIDELNNESEARIWGGMHFRTAVVDGRSLGNAVAAWVVGHHFGPR